MQATGLRLPLGAHFESSVTCLDELDPLQRISSRGVGFWHKHPFSTPLHCPLVVPQMTVSLAFSCYSV